MEVNFKVLRGIHEDDDQNREQSPRLPTDFECPAEEMATMKVENIEFKRPSTPSKLKIWAAKGELKKKGKRLKREKSGLSQASYLKSPDKDH